MEQFIYVLKPLRLAMLTDGPTPAEAEAVQAHVDYLEAESRAGRVLVAGRTQTADEATFGIVILRAASIEVAQQQMQSDPAVAGGAMTATLYPYRIAVVADDITAL